MAAKILLVEPDPEQREEFLEAIKGCPFELARVVDTNAEAIDLFDAVRPHLAILRLVSGKFGAAAALDMFRKKNRSVKVVVSYDVRSTHLLMNAYAHGALAAIKQPFRLHHIAEKLTYAIASERHDRLAGAIVRLEHPIQVRYRTQGFFARTRVGFCGRLGLSDMDLNVEVCPKPKAEVRLELLLPPPDKSMKFLGVVEDAENTRPDSWCSYLSLRNVSPDERKTIEAFLVRAAKRV